jgi:hypothetical protein
MSSLDAANFEKYYPKDLIINPTSEILAANTANDKNNFTFVAPDLKIGTVYTFQFQYVFEDGVVSKWSPSYQLTTASYVSQLTPPTITVTPATLGYIVSYTNQTDKNFDNAIIEEAVSTSSTAPSSGYQQVGVTSSNPITITVGDVLKRWVRVKLTDKIAGNTAYSNIVAVTPVDPVAAAIDDIAPDPIQSATAEGIADGSDSSGISGILNVSVVNSLASAPSDFNGYIVKIIRQSDSKEWYQTFFSKTYLTTFPVKLGVVVGQSYSLSIATTDGRNQSAFVAVTGNPISVSDTRSNTSVATNFVVSATDSILNVSWTASTDASVQSYRVQLASNADTTFSSPLQEIYANSNTVSFGGLSPSTTYRIRVTTRYGTGLLSTNHLTGTATLNASGSISDGQAPTTNPSISASNIKSLFGAFAITFPEVVNNDAVVYEVFIKTTNATGIVDAQYKVLEVGGTFAVVKTLADKTTALSYGTDYFIAIRAKDNDGVSTGTVTAVGPVQTTQVANADLAADSVYANNILAGVIDASKMTTDLMFVDKTINVGESTSLNRIRLDSSVTTPITMTDPALASPSTYSVKSRIFIGAGNYYSNGTSFYADNTGRFSIGDKLRFDGTNLTINGSGTFTGLLTTGSGSNVIKVGTGANGSNNGIYIGASTDYIYTDGTFQFGGSSGISYNGATLNVKGQLEVKGNSTLTGDLKLDPAGSGVFYIGDNKTAGGTGDKIVISSAGISAYASGNSTPKFQLAKDGTGKIGGWSINDSSISSLNSTTGKGITLDASAQHIVFTNGFLIDNDTFTYNVAGSVQSSASYYGSDSNTDGVVGDGSNAASTSFVSAAPGTVSSISSVSIKPSSSYNATTSPALFMSTSGYSTLQAGGSYISLSNTGVVINTNTTGGIALKGFTTARHRMFDSSKEAGAVLQIFSDGRVTAGRAFYRSGASETNITNISHATWPDVGLIGDVIFSTAD